MTLLEPIILETIRTSPTRLAPRDLVRRVAAAQGLDNESVRRALRKLVADNRLAYIQVLGHTFVDTSYRQAVDAGDGIILAPPDVTCRPAHGQVVIRIAPGASFGMGDHPTTRIALRLTARAVSRFRDKRINPFYALDIGTGTGVLAIAACLMGAASATGIDTDACARVEAAENARLNGVGSRMHISNADLASIAVADPNRFSLILANLRYPTLAALCEMIPRISTPGAALVFSGFRDHELAGLLESYPPDRYRHVETLSENQWCGITLERLL